MHAHTNTHLPHTHTQNGANVPRKATLVFSSPPPPVEEVTAAADYDVDVLTVGNCSIYLFSLLPLCPAMAGWGWAPFLSFSFYACVLTVYFFLPETSAKYIPHKATSWRIARSNLAKGRHDNN